MVGEVLAWGAGLGVRWSIFAILGAYQLASECMAAGPTAAQVCDCWCIVPAKGSMVHQ